jgi:hypothetical protein
MPTPSRNTPPAAVVAAFDPVKGNAVAACVADPLGSVVALMDAVSVVVVQAVGVPAVVEVEVEVDELDVDEVEVEDGEVLEVDEVVVTQGTEVDVVLAPVVEVDVEDEVDDEVEELEDEDEEDDEDDDEDEDDVELPPPPPVPATGVQVNPDGSFAVLLKVTSAVQLSTTAAGVPLMHATPAS